MLPRLVRSLFPSHIDSRKSSPLALISCEAHGCVPRRGVGQERCPGELPKVSPCSTSCLPSVSSLSIYARSVTSCGAVARELPTAGRAPEARDVTRTVKIASLCCLDSSDWDSSADHFLPFCAARDTCSRSSRRPSSRTTPSSRFVLLLASDLRVTELIPRSSSLTDNMGKPDANGPHGQPGGSLRTSPRIETL